MNGKTEFLIKFIGGTLIGAAIATVAQVAVSHSSYESGYRYGVAICERRVHQMEDLVYYKDQTEDVEKGLRDGLGTCGETF